MRIPRAANASRRKTGMSSGRSASCFGLVSISNLGQRISHGMRVTLSGVAARIKRMLGRIRGAARPLVPTRRRGSYGNHGN